MNYESYDTLTQYIENKHYNEICDSLLKFFRDTCLYADEEEYINPERYELKIGVKWHAIKSSYFKEEPFALKSHIIVEIVVLANTKVTDLVGDELETNFFSDTFTINTRLLLSNGEQYFEIVSVKYGDVKSEYNPDSSLSEFLTPYISKAKYEQYAHAFIDQFYPEAHRFKKIVPSVLFKRMGLYCYFVRMDDNISGKILFREETVEVLEDGLIASKKILAKPGTVLLNFSYIEHSRENSLMLAAIHECVHWWLHRDYNELQLLLNPCNKSLAVFVDEMDYPDQKKFKNKFFMELQARSISPLILMPEEESKIIFQKCLDSRDRLNGRKSKTKASFYALHKLCEYFGASMECAKIRVERLGFTETMFIDDIGTEHESIPFKTSAKLYPGQRYNVSLIEASLAFRSYPEILEYILSGKLVYADGLFVANDERFVRKYKNGHVKLTNEALSDVSKCCLLFSVNMECVSVNFDPNTFNFATFCSGGSKTRLERNVSVDIPNSYQALRIEGLRQKEELDEANEIISKLEKCPSFAAKFDCLLSDECLGERSNRSVGTKCHLDGKTISKYRKGLSRPDEHNLLSICGGLRLHPRVSKYLFSSARLDIFETDEEPFPFYVMLLGTRTNGGLKDWNEMIMGAYPDHSEYCL